LAPLRVVFLGSPARCALVPLPCGQGRDGTGIPPHLTEPVFTKEEFDKKRDSAFHRAVNVLRNYGGTTS